jgi:hypothetical protein
MTYIKTPVRPFMAMTELFTEVQSEARFYLGGGADFTPCPQNSRHCDSTSDQDLSTPDLLYQLFTAFQNSSLSTQLWEPTAICYSTRYSQLKHVTEAYSEISNKLLRRDLSSEANH